MHDSPQRKWFVSRNNKRYGPFSVDQLKAFVVAKKLLPNDKVCQQGAEDWVAAGALDWLFAPDVDRAAEIAPNVPPPLASDSDDILGSDSHADDQQGPLSMKGIKIRPDFTLTYGDFQLLRKLGAGGMGAVYLAFQRSNSRRIALKMLASDLAQQASFVKRFYREALLLVALNHPNIVKGYGVGEEAGIPFLAMEYIDGLSAAQILKHLGKLDVGDALHIALHCAAGLGYGHSQDVIHRDVTPGNILITRTRIVKLVDFGLAKPTNEEVTKDTQSGITLGTPKYMAPEQALNTKYADWRSDLYSLGVVLYQAITGQLPFRGDTAMELLKAKEQGKFTPAPRLNNNVPPRLDLIIDRMLAKDPRNRPQSCAQLIREIENLGVHNARLSFDPDKLRRKRADAETLAKADKLEILMIQAEVAEVRLTQEILKQKRLAAHVYVAGTTLNAVNYLRREGTHAAASTPNLIILGRNVTPDGSLAVLGELKIQSLSGLPVAVLTTSPESAWEFFQAKGFLENVFVFKHDERQMLSEFFESTHDMCLTQAE